MKLVNTIILTYTILLILSTPIFLSLKAQENGTGMATMPVQSSEGGFCKSMVETNGYECEDHNVTTKDGYILNVVRIPMGRCRDCRTRGNKSPVLLQHGVFVDGRSWLLLPPKQSLAFNLADNGYDVWLVNSRGTEYSEGHTSLNFDDPAYWNWSLDEMVAYDLPATFQYVYDQTGQKLHFVGHSLGTLMIMAAMSRDRLVNMLESVALLSPVAYMGHTTSLLSRVIADNFIAETLDSLGFYKFDMRNVIIIEILKVICRIPSVDCTTLLFTPYTGQNCCMKPSIMDIFLDHEPQPAAMKIVIHMCQLIRGGNTTMFDYNDSGTNIKHYGQPTPPAYNMIGIPKDLPIFLSHGGADALSDVDDVKLLLDSLQGHDPDKIVVQFIERFAHADYLMSGNAKEHVYDPFIAFLSRLH
ncbi:triacylglycerol lipase 2 [Gossypium raimondii]|uniref:Lipase n=1 Tax=Gossypium raimondii TaxID=29730 RepID=A0A0D2PTW6_GOSRA|nr:triacylglycerol lipase 2 [Gossypium raimondii]KJB10309.1 hypothetical protein B456_001G195400 [Gossypium raimondii]